MKENKTVLQFSYAAARFFLENMRGDYTNLAFGILKSAQVTSVVAFTIFLGIFIWLRLKNERK